MQGALERRHGPGDRAEHVGERRRDDPRRERGRVHGVIGVEDERGVERVGVLGARLVSQEHPQEVGGVGELGVGRQDVLAGPQPVVVRDQRRGLGDQAERLAELRIGRLVPPVGVVRGGGGDAGPQHGHRRRLLRELVHQVRQERRQLALVDQELVQLVELVARRELQVMQEVDDLLVAGVRGEVGDVVPDVPQASRDHRRCRRSACPRQRPRGAPCRSRHQLPPDDRRPSRDTRTSRRFCQDRRRERLGQRCRSRPVRRGGIEWRIASR